MDSCFHCSSDGRAAQPHGIAAGFSRKYFPFSLTTAHAHTPWFSENLMSRDWNINCMLNLKETEIVVSTCITKNKSTYVKKVSGELENVNGILLKCGD